MWLDYKHEKWSPDFSFHAINLPPVCTHTYIGSFFISPCFSSSSSLIPYLDLHAIPPLHRNPINNLPPPHFCLLNFSFCSLCSPLTPHGRRLICLHCAYIGWSSEEKPSVCCSFTGMEPGWLLIHHSLRSTGPAPPSGTLRYQTAKGLLKMCGSVWACLGCTTCACT